MNEKTDIEEQPEFQPIDLNDFASEVTIDEGLKLSQNNAQVKEALTIILTKMANDWTPEQRADIVKRYKK